MPLSKGKSKEAWKNNVREELKSGKPLKQALAIAYSVIGEYKQHPQSKGKKRG